jgi:hypothetical protein
MEEMAVWQCDVSTAWITVDLLVGMGEMEDQYFLNVIEI